MIRRLAVSAMISAAILAATIGVRPGDVAHAASRALDVTRTAAAVALQDGPHCPTPTPEATRAPATAAEGQVRVSVRALVSTPEPDPRCQ